LARDGIEMRAHVGQGYFFVTEGQWGGYSAAESEYQADTMPTPTPTLPHKGGGRRPRLGLMKTAGL